MSDNTSGTPWRTNPPSMGAMLGMGLGGALLLGALFFGSIFFWFFCRIEPGSNQIAIMVRKTGKDLPSGQIIATEAGQKGVQLAVRPEGRYFENPYVWDWFYSRATDIPAGKLAVLTRLFGADLPSGEVLAKEGTKGIVPEILGPGKHRINPLAYNIELVDAINIKPGNVGVITSLVGTDVLNGEADVQNTLLVGKGQKGVVPETLDPGTYYVNPYVVNIAEVNLQSQRFELSGEDAITFLTLDGFNIVVEGTIEYAILRDKAAEITHRVGDMDDIIKKIILPRARGFSRIEGSKYPAINFIVGETRQKFQDNLAVHLRDMCEPWGVAIKSVLARNILPPDDIASIIREREVAVQNSIKFDQQIEQAKSKAELTKQETLAIQNKEKVTADTARIREVIKAEQNQSVAVTAANREKEVAQVEKEAAEFTAAAILLRAQAEADVIKLNNQANADVLANKVQAFGNGMNFARYTLYLKVAPGIQEVLANDGKDSLGGIFGPFISHDKEAK